MTNIPLALPDITNQERQAVMDVLQTDRLSLGPQQEVFEQAICDFVGCKYACAVSSGTAALHLAMIVNGIGVRDEVITSSFSFIASANCAVYVGAKPVFVEVDADTWNIDAEAIESAITERTKAILPVHVFGQPAAMGAIMDIAEKHGLTVIEDSCEAIGACYEGRKAGTFGTCGAFAFYPNKQITTGEGGMLVTDNEEHARLARSLRNQGRAEQAAWLAHERLGYNYRMNELQAALGAAQMRRIDEILARRHRVAEWYMQRLQGYDKLILQKIAPNVTMSWFVFVVRLCDRFAQDDRDRLITQLHENGIGASAYFTPIHLQKFYRDTFDCREGQLPITEQLSQRTLAIPFYSQLTESQVDCVCDRLQSLIDAL